MIKKMFLISIFTIFLFSCAVNTGMPQMEEKIFENEYVDSKSNSNASPEIVQLVRCSSYEHKKYGMSQLERTFWIKVKNLGYSKVVAIHHQNKDGTWSDIPANFVQSIPQDYEIWTASINEFLITKGTQFVVKYIVNGTTYWDNNGGKNYDVVHNAGSYLSNGINILEERHTICPTNFSGIVDIRNLGYVKKVNVIYTTDNWATTNVATASYVGANYYYGYSSTPSPNQYGIEKWRFSLNIPATGNLEFVFSYDVNGTTYWDNNFGKNYVIPR